MRGESRSNIEALLAIFTEFANACEQRHVPHRLVNMVFVQFLFFALFIDSCLYGVA
jgi:hypothetical protein